MPLDKKYDTIRDWEAALTEKNTAWCVFPFPDMADAVILPYLVEPAAGAHVDGRPMSGSYPDGYPTRFFLDPTVTMAALSARMDGTKLPCLLFPTENKAVEFRAREKAVLDFRDNAEYFLRRADSVQIRAAMACLRHGDRAADTSGPAGERT